MTNRHQDLIALLGRVLLAMLFIVSGYSKISGYDGSMGYMASHGLPMVSILLPLTILVELGGGLLIVLGLLTRPVAVILFLFLIPVTLVFHTAGDAGNNIHFLKNLSIMGGMLFLAMHGPGALSLDAHRKA